MSDEVETNGPRSWMDRFRLALRLLFLLLASFVFSYFLWFLALLVEVFIFGGETPECTESNSCSAFGDVLYKAGEDLTLTIGWFSLSALLLWLLLFRRFMPIRGHAEDSE